MRSKKLIGLTVWLVVVFIAAALGGFASAQAGAFYGQLTQPSWAPPAWVFGPVWTILYVMMGIAAWLVWRIDGFKTARIALGLFLIQLALNSLWTWLFFAWQQGAWSCIEIVVLWFMILATIITFWRHQALAGILLIPYLAWVSFACVLNITLWQMNKAVL